MKINGEGTRDSEIKERIKLGCYAISALNVCYETTVLQKETQNVFVAQ
jgi:hypothetical protein